MENLQAHVDIYIVAETLQCLSLQRSYISHKKGFHKIKT